MSGRQRVAVVTGGGGGIGGAIAEELGRNGWFVVTVDPLVTLEGNEKLPEPEETTAGRIVAAGGRARASSASVADGPAVQAVFDQLAEEEGGVDAVVNVAGITRQTYFASGTEEDWKEVLTVHLGGYLNILRSALPLMEAAGHGRVIGVTSGSGWRAADAGAYSCAKRVVASLTWQLGKVVPSGVTVNAISPIAATRMVAAAAERARKAGRSGGGGGLSLFKSMPGPADLAPLAAHLAADELGWLNGQVLFTGGPEVAVVNEPRLMEAVRTHDLVSLAAVLETVVPRAFLPAEADQATSGGANPRFGPIFAEDRPGDLPTPAVRTCVVVSDRADLTSSLTAALGARSVTCHHIDPARGFGPAAEALAAVAGSARPIDAIVVATAGRPPTASPQGWERVLADHSGIVDDVHADAGWARAAADYAVGADHPVRLVTLTDAVTAGGRSRAQASAQLARAAAGAVDGRVTAFTAGIEGPESEVAGPAAELVTHLLTDPDTTPLGGAELAVGSGWIGLRRHPQPAGAITYGGPDVPPWFDTALADIVGTAPTASPGGS